MKPVKSVMKSMNLPGASTPDVHQIVITLRKTRDTIEREQEHHLSISQASMLFDICEQFNLTTAQTIFVIGKNATNNYGLFSFGQMAQ